MQTGPRTCPAFISIAALPPAERGPAEDLWASETLMQSLLRSTGSWRHVAVPGHRGVEALEQELQRALCLRRWFRGSRLKTPFLSFVPFHYFFSISCDEAPSNWILESYLEECKQQSPNLFFLPVEKRPSALTEVWINIFRLWLIINHAGTSAPNPSGWTGTAQQRFSRDGEGGEGGVL